MNHEMGNLKSTTEQWKEITGIIMDKFTTGSEISKFLEAGEIKTSDIVTEKLLFVIDGKECNVTIESSRSDFLQKLESAITEKVQEKGISANGDITLMTSDFMITDPTSLIDGVPSGKQHSARTIVQ